VLYPCDLLTCRQLAQIVKENLRPIGIEVDVEQFPIPALLAKLARGDEPYDIAVYGYRADVADPRAFLAELLALPVLDLGDFGSRMAATDRLTGRRRDLAIGRLANSLA
jgi:hypothetical protein